MLSVLICEAVASIIEKELQNASASILGEESGYTVLEARDSWDEIEKFARSKDTINLVILDVVMLNKNGKEAYNEILKIRQDAKALFTRGYTGDIVLGKGMDNNAFNFIPKQPSPIDLLKKVRVVLDN